jgi:hypothetical protein
MTDDALTLPILANPSPASGPTPDGCPHRRRAMPSAIKTKEGNMVEVAACELISEYLGWTHLVNRGCCERCIAQHRGYPTADVLPAAGPESELVRIAAGALSTRAGHPLHDDDPRSAWAPARIKPGSSLRTPKRQKGARPTPAPHSRDEAVRKLVECGHHELAKRALLRASERGVPKDELLRIADAHGVFGDEARAEAAKSAA